MEPDFETTQEIIPDVPPPPIPGYALLWCGESPTWEVVPLVNGRATIASRDQRHRVTFGPAGDKGEWSFAGHGDYSIHNYGARPAVWMGDGGTLRVGDVVARLSNNVREWLRPHDLSAETPVGPRTLRRAKHLPRHAVIEGEDGAGHDSFVQLVHDTHRAGRTLLRVDGRELSAAADHVAVATLYDAALKAREGTLWVDYFDRLPRYLSARCEDVWKHQRMSGTIFPSTALPDVALLATIRHPFNEPLGGRDIVDRCTLSPIRKRKAELAWIIGRELASIRREVVATADLIEECLDRCWQENIPQLRAEIRRAALNCKVRTLTRRDLTSAGEWDFSVFQPPSA